MRKSKKQAGVRYAQVSAVGISNMLVDVGVFNFLLLLRPTRSPELLVLYNSVLEPRPEASSTRCE